MATHEIRDPIHTFIRLEDHERAVVDSRPFQRLRQIHQLALSYLVYPGATHRRFEHSLGVMELATRIFDVVTHPQHLLPQVRAHLPVDDAVQMQYWRRVLRVAALLHDAGHLPFSHAAERELLPEGWDHERISKEVIRSGEMAAIFGSMRPKLDPDDVVKLAVGPKKAPDLEFTSWETILAEMITGDVFGADRIDYLLRDSHHAGVAYGRFDHHRLIDTLRILPPVPLPSPGDQKEIEFPDLEQGIGPEEEAGPSLGVEDGGLESAEALLLARYFMYSQVYLHDVRRMYDRHLVDFLKAWLPNGQFSVALEDHLSTTDNEVMAEMLRAAGDVDHPGHSPARAILRHEHFKVLYHATDSDIGRNVDAPGVVADAVAEEVGQSNVWLDTYVNGSSLADFPVWNDTTQRSESAFAVSQVLQRLPDIPTNRVYVARERFGQAREWFIEHRDRLMGEA